MSENAKRCTGCGETKPLTDYPIRSKNKKDGRDTRCSPCRREADSRYRDTIGAPGTDDGYAQRKRVLYEKTRKEKPRCTSCGAKCSYDKSSDPHRLCERCARQKVDRQMQWSLAGPQ